MKKILLALVLSVGIAFPALAQQYFQNTMFPYTQFGYNPAATGANKIGIGRGTFVSNMTRLQWLGFEGSPKTSYLAFETGLAQQAGYLGGLVIWDRLGPITTGSLSLNYAYEFELGNSGSYLRIGASGGLKQWSLNGSNFVAADDVDPILQDGVSSALVASLSTGAYLTGDYPGGDLRYYVGLSAQNLLEPSYDNAFVQPTGQTEDVRTFILSGGYNFRLDATTTKRMAIMPSIMIMDDFSLNGRPQVTTSVLWTYKPIAAGINYRFFGESVGVTAGFHINDNLFFGYSYDYPTAVINASNDVNSHEIVLIYRLGTSSGGAIKQEDDTFKDAGQ